MSILSDFLIRPVPGLAARIVRGIGASCRIQVISHPGHENILSAGCSFLYAFWHRYQLFLPYDRRNRGAEVLVSQSRDGELVAKFAAHFGIGSIRGSSTRGGSHATREILSRLSQPGRRIGITPDGPRGPLREVHPGILFLARESGCPIVPVAWNSTRVVTANSWDRFMIPMPFARVAFVYGEPLVLDPSQSDAEASDRVKFALSRVENEAAVAVHRRNK